jgi:RNA polymerase sigma-70 factor (ECF subfamily)
MELHPCTVSVDRLRSAYNDHSSSVLGTAMRVLGDRPLAEDVTQEIFFRLWRNPGFLDEETVALRARLLVQARSSAIDVWRANASRLRNEGRNYRFAQLSGGERDEATLATSAHTIREILQRLPDDERTPILLAFFGGLTYRQVGAMLGVPEGTTKTRIRSGLQHLRLLFAEFSET